MAMMSPKNHQQSSKQEVFFLPSKKFEKWGCKRDKLLLDLKIMPGLPGSPG